MLENFNTKKELQYQKLTLEEQKQRGILGRLVGIMADFKHPTRNGRLYTEELWDRTFEDPIMKEKISNRCLFGELGHPVDRQEIDMEKICICLAETPKKGDISICLCKNYINKQPCYNRVWTKKLTGTK